MKKKMVSRQLPLLTNEQHERLLHLKTDEVGTYSNSFELYDMIPKYVWGRRPNPKRHPHLDPITREFKHRGVQFRVTIHPAKIKDSDGKFRDYFPGQNEELVECAMRKMAVDGAGKLTCDGYCTLYTQYNIRKELKSVGWPLNGTQIKRAIQILNRTHMSLECLDDPDYDYGAGETLFNKVGWRKRKDWENKGRESDEKSFVIFHSLTKKAIEEGAFRRFDYLMGMSLKDSFARYIFRRMSNSFAHAGHDSKGGPYEAGLRTLLSDGGFAVAPRITTSYSKRKKKAFVELLEKKVCLRIDRVRDIQDRDNPKKTHDILIGFTPTHEFIRACIHANQIKKEQRAKRAYFEKKNQGILLPD